jgi:hypothetical protein
MAMATQEPSSLAYRVEALHILGGLVHFLMQLVQTIGGRLFGLLEQTDRVHLCKLRHFVLWKELQARKRNQAASEMSICSFAKSSF